MLRCRDQNQPLQMDEESDEKTNIKHKKEFHFWWNSFFLCVKYVRKKILYMRLFTKNIDFFDMLWYNKIEYFSRGVNSHEKNRNILDTLLDFDTIDFLR